MQVLVPIRAPHSQPNHREELLEFLCFRVEDSSGRRNATLCVQRESAWPLEIIMAYSDLKYSSACGKEKLANSNTISLRLFFTAHKRASSLAAILAHFASSYRGAFGPSDGPPRHLEAVRGLPNHHLHFNTTWRSCIHGFFRLILVRRLLPCTLASSASVTFNNRP
ncbi:hypothetical protein BU23DRAFT_276386 [Bimuria novae-zelandiae CBS 107.79]|uniref:Uncharacterized protein n=1 Tax=Bimuria novae-zelandiae CBS 107.79 TaxID=1447943 RepID=A0A6A5VL28_9PLEO|nr:hypothetical protein BU23DRAFT_276386 [Bimuria novae-zelandiae CBS 107.79]